MALLRTGVLFVAIGGLTAAATAASPSTFAPDSKSAGLMPETEFSRLVNDAAKSFVDYTKSASSLNLNRKKATIEANALYVYAEVARRGGEGDFAKKAFAVRVEAEKLTEALKAKKDDEAKKIAAGLAKIAAADSAGEAADLKKSTTLYNVMAEVQAQNKEMTKFKRLSTAAFNAKGQTDLIALTAHKLAALTIPTHDHVPTTDLPKGKTAADWHKSTDDMKVSLLEIAAAAKAKNQKDVRAGINKMDAACSKCHEDFRVEAN